MPDPKKDVICDNSDSENEFQPSKLDARPKKSLIHGSHGFFNKELEIMSPTKRCTPHPSKRNLSTLEEALHHHHHPKRQKTSSAVDLGDTKVKNPQGMVQFNVEESLKKTPVKKKIKEISTSIKTLDNFFSPLVPGHSSKDTRRSNDFFTSSHKALSGQKKSGCLKSSVTSLSKGNIDDDDICLSASTLAKPLMPLPSDLLKKKKAPTVKASMKVKTPEKVVALSASTSATRIPASKMTPKVALGGRSSSFWKFQHRDGPRALGSRLIPKNTSSCFAGKTFVVTGVLECIERDEVQALIGRGGGRMTNSLSKRTSYLVVGRDAGTNKMDKAVVLNVPQLTEDAFFDMVHRGFDKVATVEGDPTCNAICSLASLKTVSKEPLICSPSQKEIKKKRKSTKNPDLLTDSPVIQSHSSNRPTRESLGAYELWVEKYRPISMQQLVGQNGNASPANRLFAWLTSWQENYAAGRKVKAYMSAPPWAAGGSSDTGAWARAALLSGPPGVGKTATASVVCRQVGLATIDMNASDKRSKPSMQEEVAQAVNMLSLAGCPSASSARLPLALTSHVLIMDEVDGMAGNEDRGGMQELISIIKTSKVPVICLCNDRQSPKVRSLANYCFDLRFHRPRVEQIKAAVQSIASREGVNISPAALTEIITASNQDLRQVINSVQLWCMRDGRHKSVALETDISASAASAHKNLRLGPFDVIRKVFAPYTDGKVVSFSESMDLFFQDYSLGPLFVQENYLNVRPMAANGNVQHTLDLLAVAAADIAQSDVIGRVIQSTGAWSLLPTQCVFACLRPGKLLRGSLPGGVGGVTFPAWFGRYSTQSKNARLLSELSQHMRLATYGGATDPRSLRLDYLHPLAVRLSAPLKEGNVDSVLNFLDAYHLLREDIDTVMDMTAWQNRPSLMKGIDAKVKSTLTRSYNKTVHKVPYATELVTGVKKKGKKRTESPDENILEEEKEANQLLEDNNEEDSVSDSEEIRKLAQVTTASKSSAAARPLSGSKSRRGKKL